MCRHPTEVAGAIQARHEVAHAPSAGIDDSAPRSAQRYVDDDPICELHARLIFVHDLLAALLMSLFIGSEEAGLAQQWRLLLSLLVLRGLFRLRLRLFLDLQDEVAHHFAARSFQHRTAGDQ
jgi:hypothetical protein